MCRSERKGGMPYVLLDIACIFPIRIFYILGVLLWLGFYTS